MTERTLYDKLADRFADLRGKIVPDAPLSPYTWFRVGGPADILFQPADEADLSCFLRNLPEEIPVTVVGVGSNLLVRDGGIDGVVIRLSARGFGQVEQLSDTALMCGAAIPDKMLAAKALEHNIGGFEFYHGIPGAIGGALRMNAGANGSETKQLVRTVYGIDRKGERISLTHGDMGYTYRHSKVPSDIIFTHAQFEGVLASRAEIQVKMQEVQAHRETVQPIKEKTGGSTFKNPKDYSAWKLIDEAGMRGAIVGGAQMSNMHCNFMINTGSATADDLERLGDRVRKKVLAHSGVELEWEIKRIGRRAQ